MKKFFLVLMILFTGLNVFALDWSIANIFGGDEDQFHGNDLFSSTGSNFELSDKFKADLDDKYFYGRIGFEVFNFDFSTLKPGVYINLLLVGKAPYVDFFFGSSSFQRYALKSGELFALGDTPSFGKMLRNGAGAYASIPFGDSPYSLNLGAAMTEVIRIAFGAAKMSDANMNCDLGIEFAAKKHFSIGFTGHNILNGINGKYTLSGSYKAGDFDINAGFIYNNTDRDVLYDETRYSLFTSMLFNDKNLGLKAGFDLVSGLNNEYMKNQTVMTYGDGIPFYTAAFVKYNFMDNLSGQLRLSYRTMLNTNVYYYLEACPKLNWSFMNDMMELSIGLRTTLLNEAGSSSPVMISIPLTYKIQFKSAGDK